MILSIIIPVYNKYNFTKSCLKDLFFLPEDTHEIIIIDNASTDETQNELLKINRNNFIYIRNETNLFHSKACNIGFSKSSGDNILLLNNDIRVKSNHSNWTNEINKYCKDYLVGTTMGKLDNNFNFIKEAKTELDGNSYMSGWCVATSKDNWNKLAVSPGQIMDETLPFYFNDADAGMRCREKKISMKVVDIPVVHFGKISAAQLNINKLYNEGRKVFVKKWLNV